MALNRRLRADLVKLMIFFVVAVLITVSVVATLLDLRLGQSQNGFHAIFANATDLQAGDTVRIAGVEVGKVTGVTVYHGDEAEVDFTVSSTEHLTDHALASIQFENLLGQRYLQISRGAPGGTPIEAGATLPLTNTRPGLDLTTVFTGFQPLLAALDPQQVNELTASLIDVFQGQSGAVGNLIDETASLTDNLASKQALINQILDNLTPLLTGVNQDDTQLRQVIDGLDTLVAGLNARSQQVGGAVQSLGGLTRSASQLLNDVQPTLDQDLGQLRQFTGSLTANQNQLDGQLSGVLAGLPGLLTALIKASDQGSYLTVYICDLSIATTNPISVKLSPGVPQSPPLSVPTGLVGNPADHTQVCAA